MKLYLQSFIKTKFDCAHDALRQVEFDISAILKYPIKARFVNDQQYYSMSEHSCVYPNFRNNFQFKVEKKIDFTAFGGIQTFHINDFYSLCPITNQPDFATIYLHVHQAYINRESLLSSIIRNNGKQILSEDACNELFNTLNESVEKCIKECGYKVFLSLCFVFRKRGGISIVPYRENFTFETDSLMEKVWNHSTDQ